MIYLVGGASRSGKTSLTLRLLKDKGIPYISTDVLVTGLQGARMRGYSSGMDDLKVAARLEKILAPMICSARYCGVPYLFEGVHLRPAFIRSMIDAAPTGVMGCVLGYPDLTVEQKLSDVRAYPSEANNWLMDKPPQFQNKVVTRQLEITKLDQTESRATKVPFFDTGAGFDAGLQAAYSYLTAAP